MLLQNKEFNKMKLKSSYSYASIQFESLQRKNVTPPPYKIHGNSKKVTNSKMKLSGRFQKTLSVRLYVSFLSWWKRMKKQGKKQFLKQNEGSPTFGIGHCKLSISPIVSNGDLWSLTVWSACHNECLPSIYASNCIEKKTIEMRKNLR